MTFFGREFCIAIGFNLTVLIHYGYVYMCIRSGRVYSCAGKQEQFAANDPGAGRAMTHMARNAVGQLGEQRPAS